MTAKKQPTTPLQDRADALAAEYKGLPATARIQHAPRLIDEALALLCEACKGQ